MNKEPSYEELVERIRKLETALSDCEADGQKDDEKYRTLIESSQDSIFIIREGLILYVNPELLRISEYEKKQLIGKPFLNFVAPEERVKVKEYYFKRILGKHVPNHYESIAVLKSGERLPVEVSVIPICYHGENAQQVICRNISERKKLEKQLVQAQKLESIGHLAGGVAHDFNNMLSVIIGHTELALEKIDPADSLTNDLKAIRGAARHSAHITRQLLAFARKQIIMPAVLNLNQVIGSMLGILKRLVGDKIQLQWQPNDDLWSIKMDSNQIDQILTNLCVNAKYAIENHGIITVKTDNIFIDDDFCFENLEFTPGEYVLLTIRDTGCGMDQNTIKNLFDPFFTTRETGQGTGLGMATVYGIIKQNNGLITVDSELQKGTRFKIYLPRYQPDPSPRKNYS